MALELLETISDLRRYRQSLAGKLPVALVPTMGALHAGHGSLITQAHRQVGPEGRVISTIFVNPTQFGPNEDFSRYPRTLQADMALLESTGADALFLPQDSEIYPRRGGAISIEPGPLATILEGAIRPGHFAGVCTIVCKLLNLAQPTVLLLGQKDFQQQCILRQMVGDLNLAVDILTAPTIRESDGLAMSSRNRYLSPDERSRAARIYQTLCWGKTSFEQGSSAGKLESIEKQMAQRLEPHGMEVQYLSFRNQQTLLPLSESPGPGVILAAVKLGSTRLIDNLLLG